MRGKPNINEFLDGSLTRETRVAEAPRTPARMTKTIRLATDLDAALKEEAYTRSRTSGQRITESDIIEEALRKYFSM
jgi:hypothetical protein